jgi:hypothetical protein
MSRVLPFGLSGACFGDYSRRHGCATRFCRPPGCWRRRYAS